MNEHLFGTVILAYVQLVTPIVGGVLCASIVMGLIAAILRVKDNALSLSGKLGAVIAVLYFFGTSVFEQLVVFTKSYWQM